MHDHSQAIVNTTNCRFLDCMRWLLGGQPGSNQDMQQMMRNWGFADCDAVYTKDKLE